MAKDRNNDPVKVGPKATFTKAPASPRIIPRSAPKSDVTVDQENYALPNQVAVREVEPIMDTPPSRSGYASVEVLATEGVYDTMAEEDEKDPLPAVKPPTPQPVYSFTSYESALETHVSATGAAYEDYELGHAPFPKKNSNHQITTGQIYNRLSQENRNDFSLLAEATKPRPGLFKRFINRCKKLFSHHGVAAINTEEPHQTNTTAQTTNAWVEAEKRFEAKRIDPPAPALPPRPPNLGGTRVPGGD